MLAKPGALVRGAERSHRGELATVCSKLRGRVIGLKKRFSLRSQVDL